MAERITPGSLKLSTTFTYIENGQTELKVTKDNAMVLQLIEVSIKLDCIKLVYILLNSEGVFEILQKFK